MINIHNRTFGSTPHWILDEHRRPVLTDAKTCQEWFLNPRNIAHQQVAGTVLSPDVSVSTVFDGLEGYCIRGTHLLFATTITGGPFDGLVKRYSTMEHAEAGHQRLVALADHYLRAQRLRKWRRVMRISLVSLAVALTLGLIKYFFLSG